MAGTFWLGRYHPRGDNHRFSGDSECPQDPYETLNVLVGILDKAVHISEEDNEVLKEAVHREVQKIDRLNQARIQGFWALQRERLSQADPLTWLMLAVLALIVATNAFGTYERIDMMMQSVIQSVKGLLHNPHR